MPSDKLCEDFDQWMRDYESELRAECERDFGSKPVPPFPDGLAESLVDPDTCGEMLLYMVGLLQLTSNERSVPIARIERLVMGMFVVAKQRDRCLPAIDLALQMYANLGYIRFKGRPAYRKIVLELTEQGLKHVSEDVFKSLKAIRAQGNLELTDRRVIGEFMATRWEKVAEMLALMNMPQPIRKTSAKVTTTENPTCPTGIGDAVHGELLGLVSRLDGQWFKSGDLKSFHASTRLEWLNAMVQAGYLEMNRKSGNARQYKKASGR
jgi:hypothetical protein